MDGKITDANLDVVKQMVAELFNVRAGHVVRFDGHYVVIGSGGTVYLISMDDISSYRSYTMCNINEAKPLYSVELEEI